jgi:hypothetical protein
VNRWIGFSSLLMSLFVLMGCQNTQIKAVKQADLACLKVQPLIGEGIYSEGTGTSIIEAKAQARRDILQHISAKTAKQNIPDPKAMQLTPEQFLAHGKLLIEDMLAEDDFKVSDSCSIEQRYAVGLFITNQQIITALSALVEQANVNTHNLFKYLDKNSAYVRYTAIPQIIKQRLTLDVYSQLLQAYQPEVDLSVSQQLIQDLTELFQRSKALTLQPKYDRYFLRMQGLLEDKLNVTNLTYREIDVSPVAVVRFTGKRFLDKLGRQYIVRLQATLVTERADTEIPLNQYKFDEVVGISLQSQKRATDIAIAKLKEEIKQKLPKQTTELRELLGFNTVDF